MPLRVAVVGSGVSGLVAAHYLSRRHEVTLFEADSRLGGHTHTVDVEVPSGRYAVDTGFIVFNDWTYPNFIRLMKDLGVASQPSDMSFSVKVEKTGLEYNGASLGKLFSQRSNLFRPSFYRMLLDILRFNRESPRLLDADAPEDLALGRYLAERRYSREFIDHYVVPMGSAIWSASVRQMESFPAAYFVRFFKNHGFLSVDDRPRWRTLRGGSRSYIDGMIAPFRDRVRLNSPVRSVRRDPDGVTLNVAGAEARFDHAVLACHSDQSLRMLADAGGTEAELLAAFAYQENEAVLHTDTSVLPSRRAAWASWNYLVPREPGGRVAVTYVMNILQDLTAPETFCVSLNLEERVDPAKVIKRMTYHHPVYTARAVAAQKRWGEISGPNRTHFCGAYWGFGFHEDGVKSALRVCESLGVKVAEAA
jgi:uncharacterized protein